jgi:RNA polymerase sigma factor (sigma-70 family)
MEALLAMTGSSATSREAVLPVAGIIDSGSQRPVNDASTTPEPVPVAGVSPKVQPASTFSVTVDEVTVVRARKGDLGALEALFRTFETPVYNLARRVCRTPQDAEDVLQETFLEVVRSVARFRGEGSLAGWVRRIAVTKALMRLRAQRSRPVEHELDDETVDGSGFSAGSLAAAMARVDLDNALGRLPDTARAVMWLHDVEGYNHDEIGALWGKSPSFSKSQLARAYARLRHWLGMQGRES